jgi:hypothetical protein
VVPVGLDAVVGARLLDRPAGQILDPGAVLVLVEALLERLAQIAVVLVIAGLCAGGLRHEQADTLVSAASGR